MANFKLNQTGEQIQADLNLLDSNSATEGQVLTANGTGGASWKNASGGSGGGTEVVANPTEEASEELSKLKIDTTTYKISSGTCPDVNVGKTGYTLTATSNFGAVDMLVFCTGMNGFQYNGSNYIPLDINNGYGWYRSASGIEGTVTFRNVNAFILLKSGCTVNTPNNVSKDGVRLSTNTLTQGVLYLVHGNININYED